MFTKGECMYLRMVIGEMIHEDQLREFRNIFKEEYVPILREEVGFQRGDLAIEEGGRMAVILTVWDTRDNCLKHHASRSYRQFIAKTQHLLVGDVVVKLFRLE